MSNFSTVIDRSRPDVVLSSEWSKEHFTSHIALKQPGNFLIPVVKITADIHTPYLGLVGFEIYKNPKVEMFITPADLLAFHESAQTDIATMIRGILLNIEGEPIYKAAA